MILSIYTHQPDGPATGKTMNDKIDMLAVIEHDGDLWQVLAKGATDERGLTFCHLASTTRFIEQRNGRRPIQINDWIPLARVGGGK